MDPFRFCLLLFYMKLGSSVFSSNAPQTPAPIPNGKTSSFFFPFFCAHSILKSVNVWTRLTMWRELLGLCLRFIPQKVMSLQPIWTCRVHSRVGMSLCLQQTCVQREIDCAVSRSLVLLAQLLCYIWEAVKVLVPEALIGEEGVWSFSVNTATDRY